MQKLYFILGCTACGKGAVGCELARRAGGQIVSVDSMKVYRRMDIGTAKPSEQLRAEIPHHCIDIAEPSEPFSVGRYVDFADEAIEAIHRAGAVALAVGGTSLYIKALVDGLFEGPAADQAVRAELAERAESEGLASLHAELGRIDPPAAERIHPNDEKRIFRALEVFYTSNKTITSLQQQWDSAEKRYDCTMIGLRRQREDLHGRINSRVKKMLEAGLGREVEALLAEQPPPSPQAAQAVGYAEMIEHHRGKCTLHEAGEKIKINTRRLAKKQRTWQRRWRDVIWFDIAPDDTPRELAERILQRVRFE